MVRWLVAIAAVVTSLAAAERGAAACGWDPYTVIPRSGTIDVPTNVRVVVFANGDVRWENPRIVRSVDGTAVPIEFTEPTRRRFIATPLVELAPSTRYQLVVDDRGTATIVSVFTTGTERDDEPPAFTGLHGLRLEAMKYEDVDYGYGSDPVPCPPPRDAWYGRILADLEEGVPGVAFVELKWFRPDDHERPIARVMPAGRQNVALNSTDLNPPTLVPFSNWCARAVGYDLAGNAAGRDQLVCAEVVRCQTFFDGPGATWSNLLPACDEMADAPDAPANETAGCRAAATPSTIGLALLFLLTGTWVRRRRRV